MNINSVLKKLCTQKFKHLRQASAPVWIQPMPNFRQRQWRFNSIQFKTLYLSPRGNLWGHI